MGEREADRKNKQRKKRKEQKSYLKGSELREIIPFVSVCLISHIRAGRIFTSTNRYEAVKGWRQKQIYIYKYEGNLLLI